MTNTRRRMCIRCFNFWCYWHVKGTPLWRSVSITWHNYVVLKHTPSLSHHQLVVARVLLWNCWHIRSCKSGEVSIFFFTLLLQYHCKKGSSFLVDCAVANTRDDTARPFHKEQLLSQQNSPSAFPGITRCGQSRLILATICASGEQPGVTTTWFGIFKSHLAFFHWPSTVEEGTVPKASTSLSWLISSTRGCTNKSSIASSCSSVSGLLAGAISARSKRPLFDSVLCLFDSLVTVAWCKTSTGFVREMSHESTISTYDSLSSIHLQPCFFC